MWRDCVRQRPQPSFLLIKIWYLVHQRLQAREALCRYVLEVIGGATVHVVLLRHLLCIYIVVMLLLKMGRRLVMGRGLMMGRWLVMGRRLVVGRGLVVRRWLMTRIALLLLLLLDLLGWRLLMVGRRSLLHLARMHILVRVLPREQRIGSVDVRNHMRRHLRLVLLLLRVDIGHRRLSLLRGRRMVFR